MTHYSVCYLDVAGRTRSSEYLPFENDRAATDFARTGLTSNAIVEVWSGGDLIDRIYQKDSRSGVAAAELALAAATAAVRGDRHKVAEAWRNEGGSAHGKRDGLPR